MHRTKQEIMDLHLMHAQLREAIEKGDERRAKCILDAIEFGRFPAPGKCLVRCAKGELVERSGDVSDPLDRPIRRLDRLRGGNARTPGFPEPLPQVTPGLDLSELIAFRIRAASHLRLRDEFALGAAEPTEKIELAGQEDTVRRTAGRAGKGDPTSSAKGPGSRSEGTSRIAVERSEL